MSKRYLTKYRVGNARYGGDIWATSVKQAQAFADRRGIGEKIIGKGFRGGGLSRARTRQQKLHEAIYLGWIALEMGIMTPKQLLGDQGLIHQYVHQINGGKVDGLEKRFRALQRRIPGHNRPA